MQTTTNFHTSHHHLVNKILNEAEEAFCARRVARGRAASASREMPVTAGDYLFWIENEARLQEGLGNDSIYTRALRGVAAELRELGVTPTSPP